MLGLTGHEVRSGKDEPAANWGNLPRSLAAVQGPDPSRESPFLAKAAPPDELKHHRKPTPNRGDGRGICVRGINPQKTPLNTQKRGF